MSHRFVDGDGMLSLEWDESVERGVCEALPLLEGLVQHDEAV
jgi:hypothetical protein